MTLDAKQSDNLGAEPLQGAAAGEETNVTYASQSESSDIDQATLAADPADLKPAGKVETLKRFLPLVALVALAATAWSLGLKDYLTFAALRDNRSLLLGFVQDHAVLAVAAFILVYALSTAVSLPGGAFLTVIGGFLFGSIFGTLWTLIGATFGATAIFLVAKTALGDVLRARAGPFLQRMEAGFQENAFSYLLVLRLIPLFPFFVVNLVPAFLGVRLRTYVIATFVGIIPGSFVFTSVGAGLGSVFENAEEFTLTGVLTPEVITALVGLSLLSLLPVAYKRLRRSRVAK